MKSTHIRQKRRGNQKSFYEESSRQGSHTSRREQARENEHWGGQSPSFRGCVRHRNENQSKLFF